MSLDSRDPPVRTSAVTNLLSQGKEAFWQGDLAAEQGLFPGEKAVLISAPWKGMRVHGNFH